MPWLILVAVLGAVFITKRSKAPTSTDCVGLVSDALEFHLASLAVADESDAPFGKASDPRLQPYIECVNGLIARHGHAASSHFGECRQQLETIVTGMIKNDRPAMVAVLKKGREKAPPHLLEAYGRALSCLGAS